MVTSPRARVRRSRAQWRRLIERAERSALSTAAFCRAESISTASFHLWRRRLREDIEAASAAPPAAAAFLDLGILESSGAPAPSWDIELELGAGVVLRLRRD